MMNQASGTNGQKIFRVSIKKNKLSKRNKSNKIFPLTSEIIFRKWLYENIDRFNNKPFPNSKGGFYFKGITKAISLHIDFLQPEAELSFNDINTNENYDYNAIEYIGREKYNPAKGFYDADRIDKLYTYYNTYQELITTEVFEPIIEYCNEYFKEDNSLYLINYDGSTEGFIAPSDETNIVKIKNLKLKRKLKNHRNTQYLKYKLFTQT